MRYLDQPRREYVNSILTEFGITTDDLIAQLRARGRLREIDAWSAFYIEMEDDPAYMRHVHDNVMRRIAEGLDNRLLLTWTDKPRQLENGTAREKVRLAALEVLVSEEAAKQWSDQ